MAARTRDLTARLRRANPVPEPPDAAPLGQPERALLASILQEQVPPARTRRARRLRRGTTLAVSFAALALAAGAVAGVRWIADDVPAPGGPGAEFVAPVTEALPSGAARVRPPRYGELASPRPALLFPKGVGYWDAVARLYAARQAGRRVPAGAELVDPLPAGKVVRVSADARTSIDPAAPLGYDPATGLVIAGLPSQPGGTARALEACEAILPDRPSPECASGRSQPLVRERAPGRWIELPPERSLPVRVVGSQSLSVLDRPAGPADALPRRVRESPGLFRLLRVDPASARLVVSRGPARVWAAQGQGDIICTDVEAGDGVSRSTCSPRSTLVTFGAIALTLQTRGGVFITAGIVGDGVTGVRYPGSATTPITDNGFAIEVPARVTALTLDGPTGGYRISLFR